METSIVNENISARQPINTPQVENTGSASSPKKSTSVLLVIIYVIALSVLVFGAYFLAKGGMGTTKMTQNEEVLPAPSSTGSSSENVPPLSTSDQTTDIEKDLNDTVLEDVDSDFTSVNSDIDAL